MLLSLHPTIIVHVENVVGLFSSPSTSSQKVRKCGGHTFLAIIIVCPVGFLWPYSLTHWLCQEYQRLAEGESCHPDVWSNLACCCFMLGLYPEAKAAIQKGLSDPYLSYCVSLSQLYPAPKNSLQNRLQFHLAHKVRERERLGAADSFISL